MKSLRTKLALIMISALLAYSLTAYAIQYFIVLPTFTALEREESSKNLDRVLNALNRELYHLDSLCHDWSAWTDTYAYVTSDKSAYITTNLTETTFSINNVHLICIIASDDTIVWAEAYDPQSGTRLHIDEFQSSGRLPADHPLTAFDMSRPIDDITVRGFYPTSLGTMLVASRPIVTTDHSGPPQGAFIMGRLLNEAKINTLIEQTQVPFSILPGDAAGHDNAPAELPGLYEPLTVDDRCAQVLRAYAAVRDIRGKTAFTVCAETPKRITQKGLTTIYFSFFIIIGSGVFILFVMILLFRNIVLNPLKQLSDHATQVGLSGNLNARIALKQSDEIGRLGNAFDQMVARLADTVAYLEESEEMYRMITEHSLAYIILIQDGNIIYANQRACSQSGYAQDELVGRPPWAFAHPDDQNMLRKRFHARMSGESPQNHYEFRYITKQGSSRWMEILAVPVRYRGSMTVLAHCIDITEKKQAQIEQLQLETRLQRAQKLETLGTLAGGVAHDLNNMLCGIVTYPDMLLYTMDESNPLRQPLMTIKNSGLRAAAIVQDMLTLARQGVPVSETIDLNSVIEKHLCTPEHRKMLTFHPTVSVALQLATNLKCINGSPIHVAKTIMNLLSNAAEAMPQGGTITISTENRYVDKPMQGYEIVEAGAYAVVTVTDTGIGIAPEDREKIFDPFFTKKVMGRSGTGLGMSVVWSTVKDHRGFINVLSEQGRGSSFILYFPVTHDRPAQAAEAIEIESIMGNGQSILVVDDVPAQRDITMQILQRLGYQATAASSGEEALAYAVNHSFDLIVLDMIMDPGLDGFDTFKRILAIRPGQKALIVSGYSETERVSTALSLGAGAFIAKPYSMEVLGVAVKKELKR